MRRIAIAIPSYDLRTYDRSTGLYYIGFRDYNPALYGAGQTPGGFISGNNGQGYMLPNAPRQGSPSQTVDITITIQQAQTAQQLINNLIQNPENFNLYGNNCSTTAGNILNQSGASSAFTTMSPYLFIEELQAIRSIQSYAQTVESYVKKLESYFK